MPRRGRSLGGRSLGGVVGVGGVRGVGGVEA